MSAARHVLLALGLLLPPGLHAATIEGRVIHPQKPRATAGLEVQLLGIDGAGQSVRRTLRADSQGRFQFANLPHPGAYLLTTAYDGVGFPGGSVVFREEDPEQTKTVSFHVFDRSADASRLRLKTLRLVIEREAGRYRAAQNAVIANAGLEVVVREASQPPALRMGVLSGHAEVETPFGKLSHGARMEGDTLELRGPIYPGERETQLFYELASEETDLHTQLVIPQAVDSLELYVKDFGIEVDAGPLHPSRPERRDNGIYQRWLGFDLAAGTKIPLRIHALPPRRTGPRWLSAVLAALVAGGAVAFVIRPLGGSAASAPRPEAVDEDPEIHALRAALDDLEHDFETGKLSVGDRDRLRHDLKRQALDRLHSQASTTPNPQPSEARSEAQPSEEREGAAARARDPQDSRT